MDRTTREVWTQRIERWKESGLTAKEFAAPLGIKPRTLAWWRWNLASSAVRKGSPHGKGVSRPLSPARSGDADRGAERAELRPEQRAQARAAHRASGVRRRNDV